MEPKETDKNSNESLAEKPSSYAAETAFMVGITGMAMTAGFGYAVGQAKKQDPEYFAKGLMIGSKGIPDSGGAIAARALGYGTLLAFTGVGLVTFTVCRLCGIRSIEDLRTKVRERRESRRKENAGRSEFNTLKDLGDYLVQQDNKKALEEKQKILQNLDLK